MLLLKAKLCTVIAGHTRFELVNTAVKVLRLTAWRMPYINILYLIVKMDLKCRNAIDLPVLTTIGKICKINLRYFLPYWVKQSSRKVRQHRLNRLAVFCISISLTRTMIFQTYVLVNTFSNICLSFYVCYNYISSSVP